MTGYARKWDCSRCGESCESVDWPKVELCESCAAQHVSGDVVAAVKALLAEWNSEDFELAGLKICMDNLAATLASPEPESVVLEGEHKRNRMGFAEIEGEDFRMQHTIGGVPFGPVRLTITPIKEAESDE